MNFQYLRIIFAGTPGFAAHHLTVLLNSGHKVVAVYTSPDRRAGRGKKLTASPVKIVALENDIPVYQPEKFNSDIAEKTVKSLNADIMVVVAYGLLLPQTVLSIPRLGCINAHGSLLPRWRGAAPIQRAIWAGDKETGVTIIKMDAGLDTGDILATAKIPIEIHDTSATVYRKFAKLSPAILLQTLSRIFLDQLEPIKQDDTQASYAPKLSREEAKINWQGSARFIARCTRAFNPWPTSHFQIGGKNIKVWQARVAENIVSEPAGTITKICKKGIYVATGSGTLVLEYLQIPGRSTLPVRDLLNAHPDWFRPGNQLS